MIGHVKWFNDAKGFGFIRTTDQEDIFVHYTAIQANGYRTLNEKDLVKFNLIKTDKGLQAQNVRPLKQNLI